jgi:hypothetical protein
VPRPGRRGGFAPPDLGVCSGWLARNSSIRTSGVLCLQASGVSTPCSAPTGPRTVGVQRELQSSPNLLLEGISGRSARNKQTAEDEHIPDDDKAECGIRQSKNLEFAERGEQGRHGQYNDLGNRKPQCRPNFEKLLNQRVLLSAPQLQHKQCCHKIQQLEGEKNAEWCD